jgi:hypothetical protein
VSLWHDSSVREKSVLCMLFGTGEIERFHRQVSQHGAPNDHLVVDSITLAAAVELACIRYWANRNGLSSRVTVKAGASIWRLLESSGWPAVRNKVELSSDGIHLRTFLNRPTDSEWRPFFYATRDSLASAGFSIDGSRAIAGAFGEMANNVWDHSMSEYSGLFAFQVQPERVTFCIADVGVGVLQSLRQNSQFASLKTSTAALSTALKDGVSRFGNQGRGYGFSDLIRGVSNQWGISRLRSGEGKVVLDHTSDQLTRHSSYLPFLPGLQVIFTCGKHAPTSHVVT